MNGSTAKRVFEPRHQDGEAERVETGVQQHQVVTQRRQLLLLLLGDFLHFGRDRDFVVMAGFQASRVYLRADLLQARTSNMVNVESSNAGLKIRCRQIAESDLDAVIDLLKGGFRPAHARILAQSD